MPEHVACVRIPTTAPGHTDIISPILSHLGFRDDFAGGWGRTFQHVDFLASATPWDLTRLHQLNAIFAIFGASDRDKSLDLKGRGLRNRL